MAATRRGPKPFNRHEATTRFLQIPEGDWPAIKRGLKTEFRAWGRNELTQLWHVPCPTLVVAYTRVRGRYVAQLMMLEDRWQEPLGAISAESLQREGYAGLEEFRRYWMARYQRRFAPTRKVMVYRLRPLAEGDLYDAARQLLEHLYGEFLAGEVEAVA